MVRPRRAIDWPLRCGRGIGEYSTPNVGSVDAYARLLLGNTPPSAGDCLRLRSGDGVLVSVVVKLLPLLPSMQSASWLPYGVLVAISWRMVSGSGVAI